MSIAVYSDRRRGNVGGVRRNKFERSLNGRADGRHDLTCGGGVM